MNNRDDIAIGVIESMVHTMGCRVIVPKVVFDEAVKRVGKEWCEQFLLVNVDDFLKQAESK